MVLALHGAPSAKTFVAPLAGTRRTRMDADSESKPVGPAAETISVPSGQLPTTPVPLDANGAPAGPRHINHAIRAELQTHSGPLPSPKQLQEYEKCSKGTVNRIIKMAEDDARHRREMEAQLIASQIEDEKAERRERARGQYCAVLVCTLFLGASAAIAIFADAPIAGSLLTGGTLVTVIGFFFAQKREESRQKNDSTQESNAQSETGLPRKQHSETRRALKVEKTDVSE